MSSDQPQTSLRQRRGVWHAVLYWPGRRARRWTSLGTKDEAEARVIYEEVLPELLRTAEPPAHRQESAQPPGDDPRITDITDWYLNTHLPFLGRADKTVAKYRNCLRDFEHYCRDARIGRMSQVNWRHVEGWIAWVEEHRGPQAPKSKVNALTMLRACFNAAVTTGLIQASPISRWHMPRVPEGERSRLTVEERDNLIATVLEHAPDMYGPVAWMAYSGQSPVDTVELRRAQVHVDLRRVQRPRTKIRRLQSYPISERMLAVLDREYERHPEGEYVFLHERGAPWRYNQLANRFRRLQDSLGWERRVRFKDLRTTFGTLMAHAGCPAPLLQRFMGHTDIQTTLEYYQEFSETEALHWADRLP